MVRAASFLCFGGGFLIISPKLRQSVTDGIGNMAHQMDLYSPWSYIGGVALLLTMLMVSLYRGAQAR